MASISIVARKGRKSKNGRAPIRLRISHKGERRFVPLELKVVLSKWNAGQERVRRSHPNAHVVNAYLQRVRSEAEAARAGLAARGVHLTADRLARAVRSALTESPTANEDFNAFAREHLDGYRRRGQYGTFQSYRAQLNKFEEFYRQRTGRDTIRFEHITPGLLRDWETWLFETKGNNANTAGKALSILRTFCNEAIRQGLMTRDDYPFEHITLPSEKVMKDKLTTGEMNALLAVGDELEERSADWHVWNWFAFAFYAGGMRFSDVATARRKHLQDWPGEKARVHYKMSKTTDIAGVLIVPEARRILEHYTDRWASSAALVFPIMLPGLFSRIVNQTDSGTDLDLDSAEAFERRKQRNQEVNKALKRITRRAGIKKNVSFHLSRHQIAWHMYQKWGDIRKVQRVLGHRTVEQTETYLEGFEDTGLDDAYRELF